MKVRMLTQYAKGSVACAPGNEIEVPEAEARQLIAGRYAVAVKASPAAASPKKGGVEIEIEPAPVAVLGLEARVVDALAENDPPITTIESLRAWTAERELEEIKGIGESTANVIVDALAEYDAE